MIQQEKEQGLLLPCFSKVASYYVLLFYIHLAMQNLLTIITRQAGVISFRTARKAHDNIM
jgi:hypothetical protein